MLVQTDTRRRITLPPNAGIKPGDALNLEILEVVESPDQASAVADRWSRED